jgi:hypothetical protein
MRDAEEIEAGKRSKLTNGCEPEAEERAVSIMHVCEIRPRKDCRRNVTKVPFFELYRRKTFAAARRTLAIASALVG